jgi:MFS transporter, ACS family, pantothenate transporter
VRHNVLAEYIQDTAVKTGVHEKTVYDTEVKLVTKDGNIWSVETSTWDVAKRETTLRTWVCNALTVSVLNPNMVQVFDAVVVASGHYHIPQVPDIPGLADWKRAWPSRIQHSKSYRNPKGFEDQVTRHSKRTLYYN